MSNEEHAPAPPTQEAIREMTMLSLVRRIEHSDDPSEIAIAKIEADLYEYHPALLDSMHIIAKCSRGERRETHDKPINLGAQSFSFYLGSICGLYVAHQTVPQDFFDYMTGIARMYQAVNANDPTNAQRMIDRAGSDGFELLTETDAATINRLSSTILEQTHYGFRPTLSLACFQRGFGFIAQEQVLYEINSLNQPLTDR